MKVIKKIKIKIIYINAKTKIHTKHIFKKGILYKN